MYAVVGRSTIHDAQLGRSVLREQAIPRLREAPGFVSAHWVQLDDNRGTSMLIFETEEAANAAAEMVRTNTPANAVSIDSVEVGEVVEHA